jgi:hypothetical protein
VRVDVSLCTDGEVIEGVFMLYVHTANAIAARIKTPITIVLLMVGIIPQIMITRKGGKIPGKLYRDAVFI